MDHHTWYEVEMRVRDAGGSEASRIFEYGTTSDRPERAVVEVVDCVVKQAGPGRTTLPDPSR